MVAPMDVVNGPSPHWAFEGKKKVCMTPVTTFRSTERLFFSKCTWPETASSGGFAPEDEPQILNAFQERVDQLLQVIVRQITRNGLDGLL